MNRREPSSRNEQQRCLGEREAHQKSAHGMDYRASADREVHRAASGAMHRAATLTGERCRGRRKLGRVAGASCVDPVPGDQHQIDAGVTHRERRSARSAGRAEAESDEGAGRSPGGCDARTRSSTPAPVLEKRVREGSGHIVETSASGRPLAVASGQRRASLRSRSSRYRTGRTWPRSGSRVTMPRASYHRSVVVADKSPRGRASEFVLRGGSAARGRVQIERRRASPRH